MKYLVALILILSTGQAIAHDFKFETTHWFKKIELTCIGGTCDIMVNGRHKGSAPYTVRNNKAFTEYNGFNVELDLSTGDFIYRKNTQLQ